MPTSSPSPDYYGGERIGSNSYANSVVALRASTGKVAWHFQVVHHDLWDYDVAAQPLLLDGPKDGRSRAAVAVATKMGRIFLLDRDTGVPLYPVEERPVPREHGRRERRRFPRSRFRRFRCRSFRKDSPWRRTPGALTPEDKKWCAERLKGARSEGILRPRLSRGRSSFRATSAE